MKMTYKTGRFTWTHGQKMSGSWHRLLGPCPICGDPCFDYGGGWRCCAMYCYNSESNPAPSVGATPEWWDCGIQVFRDGSSWCAIGPGHINIQESPCGFGDSPRLAVAEFLKQLPAGLMTMHDQTMAMLKEKP